jgi:hypothetical protein
MKWAVINLIILNSLQNIRVPTMMSIPSKRNPTPKVGGALTIWWKKWKIRQCVGQK